MTYGQSIVILATYFGGIVFSLRPIGRLITRDSTIDAHEMAGLVVLLSLVWPVFWVCAGISGAARWHLRGIRRYGTDLMAEARKAHPITGGRR